MKKFISVLVSWALVFLPISVQALPNGAKTVNGDVSIAISSNNMNITASDRAIINYNSFDIAKNESVNFIQPSSTSVVLNRVILANPSSILGSLNANGRVFLINPAGIVFGADSSVNTNSFLATTLDIKDDDFLNGHYLFSQKENTIPSYILQQGEIKVSPEGFVVLSSPFVKSGGLIFAKSVKIGATDNFFLNFDQTGLVNFNYSPSDESKDVVISKDMANNIIQDVVNNPQIEEAVKVVEENGIMKLVGGSGTVLVDSDIKANDVEIQADNYIGLLSNSKLEATTGDITLFSQDGTFSSKGTKLLATNGIVELSAKDKVLLDGSFVDAKLFYIDPDYITITSDVSISGDYFAEATKSIVLESGISVSTGGGDITFEAPRITLESNSILDAGSGDVTLNANSVENSYIEVQDGAEITGSSIKISASSYRQSQFDSDSDDEALKTLSSVGDFIIDLPVTPIAYKEAVTSSTVEIGSATFNGDSISINSEATSDVSVSALFEILALAYGKSYATSTLHIASGASLNSSGDIVLKSEATSKNYVSAKATNLIDDVNKQKQANIALVYSDTKTDSSAIVDSGVDITADKFELTSIGNKDISTSSAGLSYSAGTLGTAVAVSKSTSDIKANLSGNINVNSLKVDSTTNIEKIKTSSSASVGNGWLYAKLLESSADKTAVTDKTKALADSKAPSTNSKSGVSKIALSAAFSYSEHENNTEAKITDATIRTYGDVTVNSSTVYGENGSYEENGDVTIIGDKGIKTVAIATIDSTAENTKGNSFSGAVVLTDIVNNSDAFIDDGVVIDAVNGDIGIYSKMYLGYNIEWSNIKGYDTIEDIVPKVADANFRGRLFTSYAQSNAQGTENSLSGSYNQFKLTSNTDAHIGQNVSINQNGGKGRVEVLADNDTEALNFAGVIGWTYFGTKAGSTGVGGSYLDVIYENSTKAYIEKDTVVKASDVKVAAIKRSNNLSISTAGGSGKYAISGSFSSLKTTDNTYAYIDGATIETGIGVNNKFFANELDTNLRVNAQNQTEFSNRTGGIIMGENVGVGVSGSINEINRDTKAYLNNATIKRTYSSSLYALHYIKAYNSGFINTYALSGVVPYSAKIAGMQTTPTAGGVFGIGVSGDSSVNELHDSANAYIKDSVFNRGSQKVKIMAKNNSDIGAYSGAGTFDFSKKSVGLAGAYVGNYFDNDANAYIENSNLDVGSLDIKAQNSGEIFSLAGSGTISTGSITSLAGAVSINDVANETRAYIGSDSDIVLNGDLDINSIDDLTYKYFAGALGVGKAFSMGLSYGSNTVNSYIGAYIQNSTINSDNLYVNALQDYEVLGVSATPSAALSGMAVAGSYSTNLINNVLKSSIFNTQVEADSLTFKAEDDTKVDIYSGTLSGSSSVSVGASGAKNEITNDISVYADNLRNKTGESFASLSLEALSSKDITMASVSGSGAGTASVAGGVLINTLSDTLNSKVINSAFIVDNSAKVTAIEQNSITTYGGTLSGAGSLGVGGSVVTNKIANSVNAYVENSSLEILSNNSLKVPQKDSDDYNDVKDFYGLYILALANEDLTSYVANASGAGTVGFTASANLSSFGDEMTSYVKNSGINQNSVASNQSLVVIALAHNNQDLYTGGLAAGGTAGIGGSLTRTVMRGKTDSYIDNSSVNVEKLAEIRGESIDRVNAKTVSGAGAGTISLAGSVSIIDMQNVNNAQVLNNSVIKSSDNVNVIAKEKTYLGYKKDGSKKGILAGAATLSGGGGVGVSVIINNIKNSSYANIYNSDVSAKDLVYLYALNYSRLANYAVSGNLGSFAGSGVSVINTIDSTTKAYVHKDASKSVKINQDENYVTDYQDLHVEAVDSVDIDDKLGSFSLGAMGVGGSVGVTTLRNNTQAYLGSGTEAFAKKDITIKARSSKDLNFLTTSGSGGAMGVAGALMILNAGASFDASAKNAIANTGTVLDKTVDSLKRVKLGTFGANRETEVSNELSSSSYSSVFSITSDYRNKTKAYINSSTDNKSRVNAGNVLNIEALNEFENLTVKTGGAGGGLVGIGGGVSLVYFGSEIKSFISDGSEVDFKNLSIYSSYDVDDIDVRSYAGHIGITSLGADYTNVVNRYENSSYIGDNALIVGENYIDMYSKTKEDIHIRGYGASIGTAVAGYSKSGFDSIGSTMSSIGENSKLFTKNGEIYIKSTYDTHVDSYAQSSSLGVMSATGVKSYVRVKPTVFSKIDKGSKLGAKGAIKIFTRANDDIKSVASGKKLSALSVGASIAKAYNYAEVSSIIKDNVLLNSKDYIGIYTYNNMDNDGNRLSDYSLYAKATSSAGSLIGGVGSKAYTYSNTKTHTYIGENTVLNAFGDESDNGYVVAKTQSYEQTKAYVSGDAVGLAAAGLTSSESYNYGDIYFTLDKGSKILSNNSNIYIKNSSKRKAISDVDGGAGGLLSGSGTKTYTKIKNINHINIKDNTKLISKKTVSINAYNSIYVNSYAYNTAVGLVSASSVKSEVNIEKQEANINLGDTNIVGEDVNINAKTSYLYAISKAYSKTKAAGSYSRSYAYLNLLSTLDINIADGADIIGYDSVNINADQHTDDVFVSTVATTTISSSLVGKLYATVKNNPTFKSNIHIDNGAVIESDDINIRGSSPNMKKFGEYLTGYNYVKFPSIINHSVAYYVEKKVWEFFNFVWQWVTKKELHHRSSFSKSYRYGYFKSKKTIDVENRRVFKKSPSTSQRDDFEDDFDKMQKNYSHKINFMTLNGELGEERVPMVYSGLPGSDDVDPLLGTEQNDEAVVEEGFEDEDFEDVTDVEVPTIVENYLPSEREMVAMKSDEKILIIDNKILGGKLLKDYIRVMTIKAVKPIMKKEGEEQSKKEKLLISLY